MLELAKPKDEVLVGAIGLLDRRATEAMGALRADDAIGGSRGVSVSSVASRWVPEQPAVAAVNVGARLDAAFAHAKRRRLRRQVSQPASRRRVAGSTTCVAPACALPTPPTGTP